MATHCPLLVHVGVRDCSLLTDAGVNMMATHCAELQSIDLQTCDLLTNESVKALVTHCPLLSSFAFHGARNLSDSAVTFLGKHERVKIASFTSCDLLTSGAAVALAVQLTQKPTLLRSISFMGCTRIDEHALMALHSHVPQLDFVTDSKGAHAH